MKGEPRTVHGVPVTEHAILRFLERRHGIDIKQVLEEMVPFDKSRLVRLVRTGKVGIANNLWLVVAGGMVVTVAPTDPRHKPAKAGKRNPAEREEERPRRRANGDASPNPPR